MNRTKIVSTLSYFHNTVDKEMRTHLIISQNQSAYSSSVQSLPTDYN